MSKKDKRIDAYIAKSASFAKPVLNHLREVIHKACPEVEETIKWGFPHFVYRDEILCSMASFKNHCAFGFWKASVMKDPDGLLSAVGKTSMGHFGQLKSEDDLPSDKTLTSYIKEAMKLNEAGVKARPKTAPPAKKELIIPDYFMKALSKNKKARATFDGFSYTNKKDYVEWVTGAKNDETRDQRMATSVEWMSEGKIRNWKYVKK